MSSGKWASSEVADAWRRGAEARNQTMRRATERMFEEARVVPGARVLDLGTGTGDTAVFAAERVGPSGAVVAIDSSPAMVEAARATLAAVGAAVQVQVMDAGALTFDAASFDAVVGRQMLMFLELPGALAGIARVLRAGGCFAALVWGPLADNPLHGAMLETAQAHGGWGDDPPEMARAFARTPEIYRRALADVFDEVALEMIPTERRFASAEEAVAMIKDSPVMSAPLTALPEPERGAAWTEVGARLGRFERDGACVVPMTHGLVRGTVRGTRGADQ